MVKYAIETRFINDWENVWHSDGELEFFDTYEDALNALNDFLDETAEDHFNGYIEDRYDIEDFRIVKVEEAIS